MYKRICFALKRVDGSTHSRESRNEGTRVILPFQDVYTYILYISGNFVRWK